MSGSTSITDPNVEDTPAPETVSEPPVLGSARRLRILSYALESVLYLVIAGSALAIGAVHPWAYVPLWESALLVAVLAAAHAAERRALRSQIGARRFAFHGRGRWLVLEPDPYEVKGWRHDLSRPLWPRPALFWPGVAFLGWALVQIVPLPPAVVHGLSPGRGHLSIEEVHRAHPLTLDAAASMRGIAFAASMLAFYVGGAVLAMDSACRRRFRVFVGWLGTSLALIAMVQVAIHADRIYGFFQPLESKSFFGVFVNRNHFAAYMTLCAMVSLAFLYRVLQDFRYRLGPQPSWRRGLLTLGEPEGFRLVVAVIPVLFTVAALVATTSRGGILSFVGALGLAAVAIGRHRQRFMAVVGALLVGLPVAWFGVERLGDRFGDIASEEAGRTAVWRHSLASMSGIWLTGSGLDTFDEAITLVPPLALPAGAASWPAELTAAIPAQLRIGYRAPAGLEGWQWYSEAHNDYVQLAVETGTIGTGIWIWALVLLARRLREPWLTAGIAGLLVHSTVDFSLQIPAVGVLFFVVCAYAERTSLVGRAASRRSGRGALTRLWLWWRRRPSAIADEQQAKEECEQHPAESDDALAKPMLLLAVADPEVSGQGLVAVKMARLVGDEPLAAVPATVGSAVDHAQQHRLAQAVAQRAWRVLGATFGTRRGRNRGLHGPVADSPFVPGSTALSLE